MTQAVIDLQAAADRPRPSAGQNISSAEGIQQPFVSQPVEPSLTAGQLSAAGEQGYSPAGVSSTQQASLDRPQSQQAGTASRVIQSSQSRPADLVQPGSLPQAPAAAPAFQQQGVQSQVDTQVAHPMQATAPGIQGSGQGHVGQHSVQPGSSAPFGQAGALQPLQQEAGAQASSYAMDRHMALMRAAEEHELVMQAERSSQGRSTGEDSPQLAGAGGVLPGQAPGMAPQAGQSLTRASYQSDRHAALMRAAEAHEQAGQAQAASPVPVGSASEPAGAYASGRHAALMRAALANEQAYQPDTDAPGSQVALQVALPNGVDAPQDVHMAQTGTGGYGPDRHAALMRAAEEHEQKLLQSPNPAAQQELFYVSDRHAALMRAAEEHELQGLPEAAGTTNGQSAAGYASDRHAALMRAAAANEQSHEIEQPPEQLRNEVMAPGAPTHASVSQHETNDQGRFSDHQPVQQAAPFSTASGQAVAPTSITNGGMGGHHPTEGPHAISKQYPADSPQPAANGHHDPAYMRGTHIQPAPVPATTRAGHVEQSSLRSPPEPQQDVVQLYNGALPAALCFDIWLDACIPHWSQGHQLGLSNLCDAPITVASIGLHWLS